MREAGDMLIQHSALPIKARSLESSHVSELSTAVLRVGIKNALPLKEIYFLSMTKYFVGVIGFFDKMPFPGIANSEACNSSSSHRTSTRIIANMKRHVREKKDKISYCLIWRSCSVVVNKNSHSLVSKLPLRASCLDHTYQGYIREATLF
jgi:hypothetical protein